MNAEKETEKKNYIYKQKFLVFHLNFQDHFLPLSAH